MSRMAPILSFVFASLLATAIAMPARLQKRSFKAPARGRSCQTALDDVFRVQQKYNGTVIVVQEEPSYSTPSPSWSSSFAPAPAATGSYNSPSAYGQHAEPTQTAQPSSSSSNGTEDGEVSADPEENDQAYLSPVTIGGQRLTLDFDTGSSDLWVFSNQLPQRTIGSHSIYDPSKSTSYIPYPGARWTIQYGDSSSAGGIVGFDVVDIGGSTVQKQAVELATHISSAFARDPDSDGLLGLGFSSINTIQPQQQKTFFENVMPDLSEPLFTADLMDHTGAGEYEFGRIDKSKYKGDIHYVDVDNSNGWWEFALPSIKFSNGASFSCQTDCSTAIADTGTSLMYLNGQIVVAYYEQVNDAQLTSDGIFTYPCGTTLPDVTIQIGTYDLTIKGEDMTYMIAGEMGEGSSGQCIGGLQPSPNGSGILGDMFLKQIFAVFDGGNMRFGVAEKA